MSTLELYGIGKSYNGLRVLEHIDLKVDVGSHTAIVGSSGSGKTTLLRIIAGFESPDSGQILLQGESIGNSRGWVPAHQRGIGFVPQDGALFPHFTVAGNIGFGLKGSKREKQHRIGELMEIVALDHRMADLWPHELSGGQQQRVALARALSQQPRLMLLDEPFSALDTGLRAATRKTVAEVLTAAKVASILVTHDQSEALSFADQVAVMSRGRLLQVSTPKDLYLHPVDESTASFLGEMLVLTAELEHGWANSVLGRIAVNNSQLRGSARIMLRPEQIQISLSAPTQCGQAVITDIRFAGFVSTLNLQMAAGGAELEIKTLSREGLRPGAQINLNVIGEAHIFTSGDSLLATMDGASN